MTDGDFDSLYYLNPAFSSFVSLTYSKNKLGDQAEPLELRVSSIEMQTFCGILDAIIVSDPVSGEK